MFRQNNIIWCGLIVINCILEEYISKCQRSQIKNESIIQEITEFLKYCILNFKAIILKYFGYVLLALGFIKFLHYNQWSVVLGIS